MPPRHQGSGDCLLIDDQDIRRKMLNSRFNLRKHGLTQRDDEVLPEKAEGLRTAQTSRALGDCVQSLRGENSIRGVNLSFRREKGSQKRSVTCPRNLVSP